MNYPRFVRTHVARKPHTCVNRHDINPGDRYSVITYLPETVTNIFDGETETEVNPFHTLKACAACLTPKGK